MTHISGEDQWRRGLPLCVDGDPVGMRGFGVVVGGVGVGADEDGHVVFAAAGDEFAEDVAVVEPGAAMVKRDFGGVVGDAAAAAETDGVGAGALEVVEPEGEVEVGGVVFDEGELCPAHGLGCPCGDDDVDGRGCWLGEEMIRGERRKCGGCAGDGCGLKEFAAREGRLAHARNGT